MDDSVQVALLGNGTLSKSFQHITKFQHTVYSRPALDFLNLYTIDNIVKDLLNYKVIINTIGITQGTSQEIFQVNFLAPIFLIEKLNEFGYQGKVICLGSHGSTWPSWPGISHERLTYNLSKQNLKNYIFGLSQSGLTKINLCLFDSTKFISPMSNYEGDDPKDVASILEQTILNNNPRILHVETY